VAYIWDFVSLHEVCIEYIFAFFCFFFAFLNPLELGFPKMRWHGKRGDRQIVVMDFMGPSLSDLFYMCNKKFSLKTVLMVAIQMVWFNYFLILFVDLCLLKYDFMH